MAIAVLLMLTVLLVLVTADADADDKRRDTRGSRPSDDDNNWFSSVK